MLAQGVVDHVEVFVPDRAGAAVWYQEVLGLEPVARYLHWATPRGPLMLAPAGGGALIALFERPICPEQGRAEHHRVAFRVGVGEFRRFVRDAPRGGRLHDAAGTPLPALEVVDHGGAYSVYFCDPYGNRIEVTTYDAVPAPRA
jgi:catechol 2,3-dioxygenase-like lactoylglutathione lyase family enzyme